MSKFETISQEIFHQRSNEAISKAPIRKEVNLKEIEILQDSVMKVGNRNIQMGAEAFKGICKIVGLPIGFDKTFTSSFGDKARQQLVNRLKIATQAKGNTTVSLVVNPETKSIIAVHKDPRDLVSNETFVNTATKIIDRYGLEVNNFSINYNGGAIINASSPKNQWGLAGLPDEEFFGGVSFSNSPEDGFQVSPFLHRLVCANGMVGTAFEETMKLGQMEGRTMENFWLQLNQLAERGFRPTVFEDQVRKAINTRASLFELENSHSNLKMLSNAEHKELEAWVPLHTTRARFMQAGIDTLTLSTAQKKCAKTGTSVWDCVNGLTHFGSHDNGFKIDDYDRRRLQVMASGLLTKEFDMGNIVASPF